MHSMPTYGHATGLQGSPVSAVAGRLTGADSAGLLMLVTIEAPGARITCAFERTTATPSGATATDSELAERLITELACFRALAESD